MGRSELEELRREAERYGDLGDSAMERYLAGHGDVIETLAAEEANLLQALATARAHRWWRAAVGCAQGLRTLYDHRGHRDRWARVVGSLVDDLVDPRTDGPRPGAEEQWSVVTGYRIQLARNDRKYGLAAQLARLRLAWNHDRAAGALATSPERRTDRDVDRIGSLAASHHELGQILREQGSADCLTHYRQAAGFDQQIGDAAAEARTWFNIGTAYLNVPAVRNLDQAERAYREAQRLIPAHDRKTLAGVLGQLGRIALERFFADVQSAAGQRRAQEHLATARALCQQALDLCPADATDDLATGHNQLGVIEASAGNADAALHHWQTTITYREQSDDRHGAGVARCNIALLLAQVPGYQAEALAYARAALRDHEPYGAGAAADIAKAQQLIGLLEPHVRR
ncbi:hypothetical protein [Cryptosporangium minutisporangium]|uniref:Tetratricopeptide repeat protein n=1 Tax=Cryptosporangium minutisporangium TaxID=113569 RepID=A0ABP6SRT6_9ACTN